MPLTTLVIPFTFHVVSFSDTHLNCEINVSTKAENKQKEILLNTDTDNQNPL